MNILAGTINGNLTVSASNATVNNAAFVTGTITINDVSGNTWNENASGNKLVFNDPDAGTKLVLGSNASVASIKLNKPAAVTIPSGATVGTLTVNAAGTTVDNTGTITVVEKNADVEITGNEPETVKPGLGVATLVGSQAELEIALNDSNVKKIVLKNNIETTSQVLIKQAGQTIDGAGYTISAAENMFYHNPNKSVLTVLNANDVNIFNLTVDASAVNTADKWDGLYALQVYQATGVNLDGITLMNGDAGLLVNGSSVTVNNITTSNNEFGGIEVSQGKDVTSQAQLTVSGESKHGNDNVHIWTVGANATVKDEGNQYKSGKDNRAGKEKFTNYILASENRDVPFKVLEAPTDGQKELEFENLVATDVKFLVFGLNEGSAQKVATLEEVKNHIDSQYGVTFNSDAILIENGLISIVGKVLSTEDWNKIKTNGDKTIPYKITVLNKDKTAKIAKIAIYQDGEAVLEQTN